MDSETVELCSSRIETSQWVKEEFVSRIVCGFNSNGNCRRFEGKNEYTVQLKMCLKMKRCHLCSGLITDDEKCNKDLRSILRHFNCVIMSVFRLKEVTFAVTFLGLEFSLINLDAFNQINIDDEKQQEIISFYSSFVYVLSSLGIIKTL